MKTKMAPSSSATSGPNRADRWLACGSIFWISLCGTALAIISVFLLDAPLNQAMTPDNLPGELRRAIHLSEAFAHGSGVFMILGVLFCALPTHRKSLGVVALCAYGSGLLANGVKLLLPRVRPLYFEAPVQSGLDTFWTSLAFPTQSLETIDAHAFQSFPSAHAATAVGFAMGLSYFFPRGMPAFFFLAALASFQRFFFGAHWPSDIFAGATLGMLCSAGILYRFKQSECLKQQTTSSNDSADLMPVALQPHKEPTPLSNSSCPSCQPVLE